MLHFKGLGYSWASMVGNRGESLYPGLWETVIPAKSAAAQSIIFERHYDEKNHNR